MHVAGTYLCQTFGIMSLSMVRDSAQILFKQENKEQSAIHVAAECKMNKKMPGLSTGCKTIIQ